MPRALIFHASLFERGVGSTEKFLVDLGREMAEAGWDVAYAFASVAPGIALERPGPLFRFSHGGRNPSRPFRFASMVPALSEIVLRAKPDLFISPVWDRWQFPFIDLQPDLPVIQLSPHGAYCPYGDVRHVWVQGAKNLARVRAKGAASASQLFNPLPVPPLNHDKARPLDEKQIVFGRTGRADPKCFDPISLDAFNLLVGELPFHAYFWYVAPCERARAHVAKLGLQAHVQFIDWLEGEDLAKFYQQIDVFAHARKDGETCGIAIAEAMLAQNPVITHRSVNHNEHIDGPLGVAMRVARNAEEYAAHMRAFVLDRAMTAQTGVLSRKLAAATFGQGWGGILREIDAAMARRPGWSVRRAAYRAAGAAMSLAGA